MVVSSHLVMHDNLAATRWSETGFFASLTRMNKCDVIPEKW